MSILENDPVDEIEPTADDSTLLLTDSLRVIRDQNDASPTTEQSHSILPSELKQHLSDERLARNAAAYPEMSLDIEPALLDEVREGLLALPLIHRTDAPRLSSHPVTERTLHDTPVPHSAISPSGDTKVGNTHAFDQSLGLDECVFMHWGGTAEHSWLDSQASHVVLIDPTLILSERCIVTPKDIVYSTKVGSTKSFSEHTPDEQKAIENEYFDKAVTGRDWLEILTRRLAIQLQERREKGDDKLEIDPINLGEIKFFGVVPRTKVIASIDYPSDEYEDYSVHVAEQTPFRLFKRKEFSNSGIFA